MGCNSSSTTEVAISDVESDKRQRRRTVYSARSPCHGPSAARESIPKAHHDYLPPSCSGSRLSVNSSAQIDLEASASQKWASSRRATTYAAEGENENDPIDIAMTETLHHRESLGGVLAEEPRDPRWWEEPFKKSYSPRRDECESEDAPSSPWITALATASDSRSAFYSPKVSPAVSPTTAKLPLSFHQHCMTRTFIAPPQLVARVQEWQRSVQ